MSVPSERLASLQITLVSHIREQWQKRSWFAWVLWPLSLLTLTYIWANTYLYKNAKRRTYQLAKPVIVVGNVVVGGAGKTPVVIELVKYLSSSGRRVGVISKGYGREKIPSSTLHLDTLEVFESSSSSLVGDEPKLIHHKTSVPVFVGDQRALAAHALLQRYPNTDVIISDDGLQHNALGRDINIIVFDNSGLGNGLLLPAGPLREPWPRVFKNASTELTLSTNEDRAPQGFTVSRALADFAINKRGQRLDLRDPLLARVHAVAGIARPEIFFEMLVEKGIHLSETTLLEDHAAFKEKEFDFQGHHLKNSQAQETVFLCTEKDAIKIWEFNPDVWAVPLICKLDPKFTDELEDALIQLEHCRP
jgi:tetraacyldisaccharide 4'-kinase